MGKYVDRIFIEKLTQCYYNRRKNHVSGCFCYHCKRYHKLSKEKVKWSFDGLNLTITDGFLFLLNRVI